MAYLDRVVNAGGRVEREFAIGRGRMDLCLTHGDTRVAMELKVWRSGRPDPLDDGLTQLDGYLAGLGLDEGWLVIFDQREEAAAIEERVSSSTMRSPGGRTVTVIRA